MRFTNSIPSAGISPQLSMLNSMVSLSFGLTKVTTSPDSDLIFWFMVKNAPDLKETPVR
jgi:hypothetical protein